MAIKTWTTNYPTTHDTLAVDQPDLVNAVDDTDVSQIHAVRDKTEALAQLVGTSPAALPAGCLLSRKRLCWQYDLPAGSPFTKNGPGYATAIDTFFHLDRDEPEPSKLYVAVHGNTEGGSGAHLHCKLTLTPLEGQGAPLAQVLDIDYGDQYVEEDLTWTGLGVGWYGVKIEIEDDTAATDANFESCKIYRMD